MCNVTRCAFTVAAIVCALFAATPTFAQNDIGQVLPPIRVTISEDTAHTFKPADFGLPDPKIPAGLTAVGLSLPAGIGELTNNGAAATAADFVSLPDIAAGHLKFIPRPNANGSGYATMDVVVRLLGDQTRRGTVTIDVASVNDPPSSADQRVMINADKIYTFTAADFAFTDPNDIPSNNFAGVRITGLPGGGMLTVNGVPATEGTFITLADINAGNLKFMPKRDSSSDTRNAPLLFQIQDDGGTANGGVDLDPTPRSVAFQVIPVQVDARIVILILAGLGIYFITTKGIWVPPRVAGYFGYKSLPQFVITPGSQPTTENYEKRWNIENFRNVGIRPFRFGTRRNLYDVAGRLLFYDFVVDLPNKWELRARMAANLILGFPVVSIGVNKPLPIDRWMTEARETARKAGLTPIDCNRNYPVGKNPALVCYAYPLLGMLCRREEKGKRKRYVIRLDNQKCYEADVRRVRKRRPVSVGGHSVWSPLDFSGSWAYPKIFRGAKRLFDFNSRAARLAAGPSLIQIAAPQAPAIVPGHPHVLNVQPLPQEEGNFCAPATAKMILQYDYDHLLGKSFNESEQDIADDMGLTDPDHIIGVGQMAHLQGYGIATRGTFLAQRDDTITFPEARDEINNDRPFVSGIVGHVRAAIGWDEIGAAGKCIFINDPLPEDVGEQRWEPWAGRSSDPVNYYCYVRPTAAASARRVSAKLASRRSAS